MSDGFRKLLVYNKAYNMVLNIYAMTKDFPKEEIYGITYQLRRSSTSISANIAEGYSKGYLKEYIKYIGNAIGSYNELDVFIDFSRDLKYMDEDEFCAINKDREEISMMFSGLGRSLKRKRT